MSLIDDYIKYTSVDQRSTRFHTWSIIAGISAALERRVWLDTALGTLTPNMYVLLVGAAGTGKSSAIKRVESFIKRIDYSHQQPRIKFAPSKITPAALIETLTDSFREYEWEGKKYPQCPVFASIYELSDFFTDIGGGSIMKELLTYYDPPGFLTASEFEVTKKTRSHKDEILINPSLTVLAGTTPDYLAMSLATDEGRMGLASRIVFCVDTEFYPDRATKVTYNESLASRIAYTLSRIARMKGPFVLSAEADALMPAIFDENNALREKYHKSNLMYEQYYNRRLTQIQKLSMIMSASRASDRRIEVEDIQAAIAALAAIEPDMPKAFGMRAIHKDPLVTEILLSAIPNYPTWATEEQVIQELRRNGMTFNFDFNIKAALHTLEQAKEIITMNDRDPKVYSRRKR